jgi:hypothetical protein
LLRAWDLPCLGSRTRADCPDHHHARKIEPMDVPKLLSVSRKDWWLLAVVISILWATECVLEGNTLLEMLIGPVIVALWAGAI